MAYIYDLTDTWNAGGTTFYGIKMNVTNTASASGSKLLSLQVGGSELFGVGKDGNVGIGTSSPSARLQVREDLDGTTGVVIQNRNGSGTPVAAVRFITGGLDLSDNRFSAITSQGVGTTDLRFLTSNAGAPAERMRIDSSGNVGIGTGSPATKLDVAGNLRFSAANPVIELNSGGPQVYTTVANTLQFATGGGIGTPTERMRIDNNGNVGIGTTSPTFKFVSANNVSDGQWFGGSTTLSYMGLGNYRDAAGGAAQISYERTTGAFVFGNGSRDTPTERMRIDNSGNVGIGTSAPGQTLQVVNGGNYQFRLGAGSAFNYDLGRNSSDGLLYFYGNQSGFTGYVFGGADGERMRITPQGNLQLGKASLATTATDGFPYIPTCAGTPTGTPTAITGYAPMVVDSTNNKLYVYVGGAWQAMN